MSQVKITADHLRDLRLRAVTDNTRDLAAAGGTITHEELDELEEGLDQRGVAWARDELGLRYVVTGLGIELQVVGQEESC